VTDCNGCGGCCDPFITVFSPASFGLGHEIHIDGSIGAKLDPDELAFAREHLTAMRRSDGRNMVRDWSRGYSEFIIDGDVRLVPAFYYRCDRYDPTERRCTDYDNRPDCCRGYPWYGDPPDTHKALPPTCSYNADIGRPVAEMPVELQGRP
jgi:Fe-S-cluster containining protein